MQDCDQRRYRGQPAGIDGAFSVLEQGGLIKGGTTHRPDYSATFATTDTGSRAAMSQTLQASVRSPDRIALDNVLIEKEMIGAEALGTIAAETGA